MSNIQVSEIAFTSYPVTEMARARAFYEGLFGFKASYAHVFPDGSEFTEYEIGTGAFCLVKMPAWNPSSDGPNAAFEVGDFDAAIARLREAGARFALEPFDTPVCRMAIVFDSEGNHLNIHSRKSASH